MEEVLLKKIFASLLAITILFSPIGNFVFNDSPVAEAKRYKSGKKNFNIDKQKAPSQSTIKKEQNKKNDQTTTPGKTDKKSTGGGLMKGLIAGGLAGLLFGSLFANMGMLGSMLGFMVNILALLLLALLIKKVISLLFSKKKDEEAQKWQP